MDYYYIIISLNNLITLSFDRSVPEQSADVITGYVHKISEVHTPTKGNVYFNFNLQLSPSKVVRGVCYSPEKRAKLKETRQKKIAVKIDNVQASIARRHASEQEYTVKKNLASHHPQFHFFIMRLFLRQHFPSVT